MTLSRPKILLVLALAVVAAWVLWPHRALTPVGRESLVVGKPDLLHSLPVILAEEQGFFRDEGLDVTFRTFPSGKMALAAMFDGEVEVAAVAEVPLVLASFRRRDFVIVATFMGSYWESKVVARADRGIRTVADLRGRRIGVPVGTSAHVILDTLLADHGLSPRDVVEVPLSPTEIVGRLMNGQVDAIAAFEPQPAQAMMALDKSRQTVIRTDRVWTSFNYVTPRDLPQRRPEALARLLRATDRAIAWGRDHRQETIAIMMRRLALDGPMSETVLKDFRYALSLDQTLLLSLEDKADWAIRTGQVSSKTVPNYLDFVDMSIMEAVKPAAITIIH
ncbi:MAG: transporter substrate-binding protein [Rhodocyclaceae bacterium]|nr:transporter substrate-binding protein [Rhodocyclaceae bacterium]